ncbi:YdcH family protein [Hirschia maritima]|uniref:YdcH family protein n=1 Tax=Hirschia maritima TaxID=1121961 RepID=UPI000375CEDC|nr:DUF465 domain-containing protein [Hirschia maritima]
MSHTPHELHEEFPDAIEKMRALKETNAHFVKLADEYHDVNREIHRIEVEVDAASDFRTDELRKTRLKLKDEIAQML